MEKETFLGHVSDDALKEIVAIQDRIKKLDNSAESKQDFIAYIKNGILCQMNMSQIETNHAKYCLWKDYISVMIFL